MRVITLLFVIFAVLFVQTFAADSEKNVFDAFAQTKAKCESKAKS